MKILTKQEEQEHYNATVTGGLLGGTTGTAIGALGVYGATQRYPAFRALTLPFRAFLIASTGTFSAIIAADRYSRAFEHARNPEKSYSDSQQTLQQQVDAQRTSKEKVMAWLAHNRYSIVFGSWVVSMSAAMGIVGRSPYLTTQQKLVQARVYAQGFTIAAVIVSLAFEGGDRMNKTGRWETVKVLDPNDPEHKHMIEKRIHHEQYEGEDQWMDMVEAEEARIKEREKAVKEMKGSGGKSSSKHDSKHEKHEKHDDGTSVRGNPEKGDKKVLAS